MQPNKLRQSLLAALASVGAIAGVASATSVTVGDYSFEQTVLADGVHGGLSTNWSGSGNGGYFIINSTDDYFAGTTGDINPLPAPADGTNCYVVNLTYPGYLWQKVGAVQPSTIYTLTVAVGRSLSSDGGVGKLALVNGVNPFGTILASTPVDSTAFDFGTFADTTLVFTTGQNVSGPLTILIESDTGTQLIYDNVRLDASPAPSTPTAILPSVSPTNVVFQGTTVTLTEDPAGLAPFTFQWQTDKGTGTFTDIAGATSTNYVVDTSAIGTSGIKFRVVVTNSKGTATSGAITISTVTGIPTIVSDTIPSYVSDVVGNTVTFKATFEGSMPITYQWQKDGTDIPGATNTSLTLSNIQSSDWAGYALTAQNTLGSAISTSSTLMVNDFPSPTNGVYAVFTSELGRGGSTRFQPTWTLDTGSLIAGFAPSTNGDGNFSQGDSGTLTVLTDGSSGTLYPAGNGSTDFVTCGNSAGQYITYTLPVSATGYDLTKIVVYGGWSDAGRDEQDYIVAYSTVANPTVFNAIVDFATNPDNPNGLQSATRSILTSATGTAMAKNVAAVKFIFNDLGNGVENGFAGYSELQVFGTISAPAPVIASDIWPGTSLDVVGSSITVSASFSSSTPITYQWEVDKGNGYVNVSGANSTNLVLSNLKLTDSGNYHLKASNASGTTISSSCTVTVNAAPDPDAAGVLVAKAGQTGTGDRFTPTWTINTNSIIFGTVPSSMGGGSFTMEGALGTPNLTDGTFGAVGNNDNTTLATCGSSQGKSLVYTLPGSDSGYDITKIVTYGGWSDRGRDEQAYTVSYALATDPNTFITLTSIDFNPDVPGGVKSTDRVTLSNPANAAFAKNIVKIMFDFTNPAGENGYSGYAEIEILGTPSAVVPTSLAPYIATDTLPTTASDVVGSDLTLTARFGGTAPITYQWQVDTGNGPVDIAGATSSTLTLKNLQVSDTGAYSVVANNSLGSASSTPSTVTVNPVPTAVNGILVEMAAQTGTNSGRFTTTWTVPSGSLLAGALPSDVGTGSAIITPCGGVSVLTDGSFGYLNPPGDASPTFASLGSGAGLHYITYTFTGAATISNIVVFSGHSDGGRDQQAYTVYYSTVADPATFVSLATVNYNPTVQGSIESAARATLVSPTGGAIASNVGMLKFDFTNPAGENGWSGYSEIDVLGAVRAVVVAPTLAAPIYSEGSVTLSGTGGTPGAAYTWLTSTNITAPIANWTVSTTGTLDSKGAFSVGIPVTATEATRFFRLKVQ